MEFVIWAIITAATVYPMWKILERVGIKPFWALVCIVPLGAIILLWVIAFKSRLSSGTGGDL